MFKKNIHFVLVLTILLMVMLCGCGGKSSAAVRIGSLKGSTSMGLLPLMDRAQKEQNTGRYAFQMAVGADELLTLMAKGELDIALVPANAAAVLYNKTHGEVAVIDINTMGVLYLVTGKEAIEEIKDLCGKTVYLTGKGATPEAVIRYLLDVNGITDEVTLEFKSEATEVAAVLAENPSAVGLLPQPFVTAALMQNDKLQIAIDLNKEWMHAVYELQAGNSDGMVTGVTVVRKEFLEQQPRVVKKFLEEHAASVDALNGNPKAGAQMAVKAGIVAKESIAEEAIPKCNIVCLTGQRMKENLSAYLAVLADYEAALVGGELPGDDFYYLEE